VNTILFVEEISFPGEQIVQSLGTLSRSAKRPLSPSQSILRPSRPVIVVVAPVSYISILDSSLKIIELTFGPVGETLRMLNGLNFDRFHSETATDIPVFFPRCLNFGTIIIQGKI